MSLNTDIVKIKMVATGYLKNYPPHLISDDEMCEAFLNTTYPVSTDGQTSFSKYHIPMTDEEWEYFKSDTRLSMFRDYYGLPDKALEKQYRDLVSGIVEQLILFEQSMEDGRKLPDWVLSYMNLTTIGAHSEYLDVDGMLMLMGLNMIEPEFTPAVSARCYEISVEWLKKTNNGNRPATIFGEPHIIKYLRLQNSNLARK